MPGLCNHSAAKEEKAWPLPRLLLRSSDRVLCRAGRLPGRDVPRGAGPGQVCRVAPLVVPSLGEVGIRCSSLSPIRGSWGLAGLQLARGRTRLHGRYVETSGRLSSRLHYSPSLKDHRACQRPTARHGLTRHRELIDPRDTRASGLAPRPLCTAPSVISDAKEKSGRGIPCWKCPEASP